MKKSPMSATTELNKYVSSYYNIIGQQIGYMQSNIEVDRKETDQNENTSALSQQWKTKRRYLPFMSKPGD